MPAKIGDPLIIRYKDHVLFKHAGNPKEIKRAILRNIGWLESEDEDSITITFEQYPEPTASCPYIEVSGLTILRSDIVEIILLVEHKTLLNKSLSKGIKTIKLNQKPLSMRSKERKTQGSLRK